MKDKNMTRRDAIPFLEKLLTDQRKRVKIGKRKRRAIQVAIAGLRSLVGHKAIRVIGKAANQ